MGSKTVTGILRLDCVYLSEKDSSSSDNPNKKYLLRVPIDEI